MTMTLKKTDRSGTAQGRGTPALLLAGFAGVLCVSAAAFAVSGCRQAAHTAGTATYESRYSDIDMTCQALKTEIERRGLVCQGIRNLNASMSKHGVNHDRQVRVVEFCRADYAHAMLSDNPEICTLMPCTFGVYEHPSGKVMISARHQQAMVDQFSGKISRMLAGSVAKEQEEILGNVCGVAVEARSQKKE